MVTAVAAKAPPKRPTGYVKPKRGLDSGLVSGFARAGSSTAPKAAAKTPQKAAPKAAAPTATKTDTKQAPAPEKKATKHPSQPAATNVATLQTQVKDLEEHAEAQNQLLGVLSKDLDESKKQAEAFKSEVTQVKNQLEDAQDEIAKLKRSVNDKNDVISQLQQTAASSGDSAKAAADLTAMVQKYEKQDQEQNAALQKSKDTIRLLQDQITNLKKMAQENHQQGKGSDDQVTKLSSDLQAANQDRMDTVHALGQHLAKMQDQLKQVESHVDSTKTVSSVDSTGRPAGEAALPLVQGIEREIATLKQDLAKKAKAIASGDNKVKIPQATYQPSKNTQVASVAGGAGGDVNALLTKEKELSKTLQIQLACYKEIAMKSGDYSGGSSRKTILIFAGLIIVFAVAFLQMYSNSRRTQVYY